MPLLKNLKRLRKAARMGFIWMGTTRFRLPQKFYWNEKQWCLHAPPEETLRWVFRDLLLDDEYGIEKLKRRPQTILDVGANIGMFRFGPVQIVREP